MARPFEAEGELKSCPPIFGWALSIECQAISVASKATTYQSAKRPPQKAAATQARPTCHAGSIRGAVEIVVGGVSDFGFGAAVRGVASRCRRHAALGVNALNGCDSRKNPVARMIRSGQQQPRN